MEKITIETNRLILSSILPKTVHHLINYYHKETIMNKLGTDEEEYRKYEQMHLKGMETFQISFYYFLINRKDNNAPIGECGFHTWIKKHRRGEIFYKLNHNSDKINSFISEALPVVLQFGFEKMDLNRIEAFIADYNEPSKQLLLKNNFIKEGTLKSHYFLNGVFEDSDCYSLLRNFKD